MWFIVDQCRRVVSSKYEITTSTTGYVNILVAYKATKASQSLHFIDFESENDSMFGMSDDEEIKPVKGF